MKSFFFPQASRLTVIAFVLFCAAAARAQTQFQGWCSEVKIQIVQELALERTGFEATLTVTNNDGFDALTDFNAELYFEDPAITAPGADKSADSLFFVRQPTLENVNRIDGTGVIAPTKTAIVKWFIIPTIGAGARTRPANDTAWAATSAANCRGWKYRSRTCSPSLIPSR